MVYAMFLAGVVAGWFVRMVWDHSVDKRAAVKKAAQDIKSGVGR